MTVAGFIVTFLTWKLRIEDDRVICSFLVCTVRRRFDVFGLMGRAWWLKVKLVMRVEKRVIYGR